MNLWLAINSNVKFIPDINAALQEIACYWPYKKPSEAVAHWRLSAYNVTTNIMFTHDDFFLLYYSWMRKQKDKLITKIIKALFSSETVVWKKPKSQSVLFKIKLRRKESLKKGRLVNLETTRKSYLSKFFNFIDCQSL